MVPAQPLRLALPGPEHVADGRGDHAVEDRVALGDLEEVVGRVVEPVPPLVRVPDLDAHERVDVAVGEGIEDHGVHDAVDRRRGHDPEGDRNQRGPGHSGVAQERPGPEAQVAEYGLEPEKHDRRSS